MTLSNPKNCSLLGSSAHGILQARIPEWAAIPLSRVSSLPRGQNWVSCIVGGFFTICATREVQRITTWSRNSTSKYILKSTESRDLSRYLYTNAQDPKGRNNPNFTHRWMDKQNVVYTHNGSWLLKHMKFWHLLQPNLYAEYIMWNAGLDEAQVGVKIARRNINNLR